MLAASGCVSTTYIQNPIELQISNQQPALALATLEQLEHKTRDRALYHLDKAVLLRMDGRFEESNAELEIAKTITTELDAVSLREQTAARATDIAASRSGEADAGDTADQSAV